MVDLMRLWQLIVIDSVRGSHNVLVVEIEQYGTKIRMFMFDYFNAKTESNISAFQPVATDMQIEMVSNDAAVLNVFYKM